MISSSPSTTSPQQQHQRRESKVTFDPSVKDAAVEDVADEIQIPPINNYGTLHDPEDPSTAAAAVPPEMMPLNVGRRRSASDNSRSSSITNDSAATTSYGSEADDLFEMNEEDDEDNIGSSDDDDEAAAAAIDSFHLGKTRDINSSNIWASVRRTSSFHDHGDEYKLVPSQLKDNVKLCVDLNLHHKQQGRLYFDEAAFYNNHQPSKYAMTIKGDIFRMIIQEVEQAYSAPCGLYFCCHGGDAAHTGVSHDDYVDIRLAWAVVVVLTTAIVAISVTVPWPNSDTYDDDVFNTLPAAGG